MSRLALATLLALTCALASASAAEAGFVPGNDVIAEGENFSASGVASNATGNTIVAWSQRPAPAQPTVVRARRLSVTGALGPILELDPATNAFQPDVAMAADGRAFAAWRSRLKESDPSTIKGRWIELDGTLGPLLTLIVGQAATVEPIATTVVVDPAGVATVAWRDEKGSELGMRRVQPNSTLSALVPDVSGATAITAPRIAALPSGATVAVWRNSGIEGSTLQANLAITGPVDVSTAGLTADPEIAADSLGNALAVWRSSTGENDAVRARRMTPAGVPTGAELTVDPLADGFVGAQVRVAADSAGDFLVNWNRQDPVGDAIVYARGVNSAGVFAGPAQPLSASPLDSDNQRAALMDDGTGAAAWDSEALGTESVLGRTFGAAAIPTGNAATLAAGGGQIWVAGVPAAGFAAFLVDYPTGPSTRTAVVRRFMSSPACADSNAAVTQGQPLTVPASCTGLGIASVSLVAAPQHGSVAPSPLGPLFFTYAPDPGFDGSDSFTYAASNESGASAPARVTIAVGKDTVKPSIKKLKLLRKRAGGKQSFKFRLVFSEPATAKVTVKRVVRVGGKTKLRKVGAVVSREAAIRATIAVKGKLARKLRAGGRFRAVVVATDPSRNASKPKKLSFRVR